MTLKPYTCPVCGGSGIGPSLLEGTTIRVNPPCPACRGLCVVWGPPPDPAYRALLVNWNRLLQYVHNHLATGARYEEIYAAAGCTLEGGEAEEGSDGE